MQQLSYLHSFIVIFSCAFTGCLNKMTVCLASKNLNVKLLANYCYYLPYISKTDPELSHITLVFDI